MNQVIEIYQWEISPYCEKIRKILDYKGVAYRTLEQPLLRRPKLLKETGQQKVPVIRDGGRWVADSTDIALYLEERYPEKPILPADPRERALCLLLEDWADEALASTVQPTKWLTPGNIDKLLGRLHEAMPGALNGVLLRTAKPVLARQMEGLMDGRGKKRTAFLLGHQLDLLERLLTESDYLFGDKPTLADFAVAALVHHWRGLAGYEELTRRRAVARMVDRIDALESAQVS